MRKRAFYLVLLLIVPLAAAGATWAGRYVFHRWNARPVLDYPRVIDLGECERGEVAVGRFSIVNRGQRTLIIDQIATSCSCAGLEQEEDGKWVRVASVEVPPEGKTELAVRVSVGMPEGEQQLVQIAFSSNDPESPAGAIQVVIAYVQGGVYAVPGAVLFGQVRAASFARRVVNLYDNHHSGRRVAKVRSLRPECFGARLLPLNNARLGEVHERGGRLIARVEVIARTSRAGPLQGAFEITLAGEPRRPDLIGVFGEIVDDIECRPSTLILPRRVGNKPVYSGQVFVRHRDGQPMQLEVESAPAGVNVKTQALPSEDLAWTIQVECAAPDAVSSRDGTITLRCRSGQPGRIISIPLLFDVDPSSRDEQGKKGALK